MSREDVTVVIPCLEANQELETTVISILASAPRNIILVTTKRNCRPLEEMVNKLGRRSGKTELQVKVVQDPNKRDQMAAGIRHVNTEITVFADDDVEWPPNLLQWIIAPFEAKEKIGAVVTCQRLQRRNPRNLIHRIWLFLGALYLERRNFDCAATNYMDGGIPCISGRTAAYRTSIVKDEGFLKAFCDETCWGKKLGPDDDNFLTRWMIEKGWDIFFQNHPDAMVQTTLEDNTKYLLQCLRWSRSNWRSNLKSLVTLRTWRVTGYDQVLHFRSLALLLGWMFVSKFIKFVDYYRQHPSDIVLLPVSILFGYVHGIIKIYAFLTLHVTTWGGREVDVDARRRKDDPSQGVLGPTIKGGHTTISQSQQGQAVWRHYITTFQLLAPVFWPEGISQWLHPLSIGVCILVDRALNVMTPFQTGQAIQDMISRSDREILTVAIPYLLEHLTVTLRIQRYCWWTLEKNWSRKIKVMTYNKVMGLSGDFHLSESSDPLDLMSRLGGLESLVSSIAFPMTAFLDLILSVHALYLHFGIRLAVYYSITAATYLWYSQWLLSPREMQKHTLENKQQESLITRESIANWLMVASHNRFLRKQGQVSKAVDASLESSLRQKLLSFRARIIKDAIILIAVAMAAASQQDRQAKDLVIIWTLWTNLSNVLGCLTDGADGLKRIGVQLEPVIEVLKRKPAVFTRKDAPILTDVSGDIEFKNVTFSYGGQPVLNSVSFHLHGGQTTAIVGPSGSGKSTILNLLLRLFDPQSGSISVQGHNISEICLGSFRDSVAVVHQDPKFFTGSVRQNIAFIKDDVDDHEIEAAWKAAEIYDYLIRRKGRFDTNIQEMSGGQRQRIAIARGVVRDAQILCLDEPTSHLDGNTAAKIWGNLKAHFNRKTVVMVTHQLHLAKDAHCIIVMQNGEAVEQGTHAMLMEQKGCYYKMWKSTKE
ncbi:ATP-binding cassette sub-family B member 7 [Coccidioides immitis RMSCC 3703]|uniref:ATP-binding cassette sub-family B member 7 n=1 Tax=Coccidioides immitis RMSCC 3703 TaxID=454286 RepID=A0A0J8TTI6_COCIT|nr:ATP-binding cassette sub-family B member 7 [Coccidioides immitis RMSCC 3703]